MNHGSALIAGLLAVGLLYGFFEAGAAGETAPFKSAGTIVGKVRVEGHFDRPPPLKVYKNREFCGAQVPNESLLITRDGAVQNVVITARGFRHEATKNQAKELVLDNRNCAFVPRVQAGPIGSEVLLLNSDPILHNVHARLGTGTLFNVGLPRWRRVKKRLAREGIITIDCDVLHTWMRAYIVVTSSPHFAVTDKKGEFIIGKVPPGTYEIEAWHETLGTRPFRLTVDAGSTVRVDFSYRFSHK
jgi:hypothetical protein